MRFLFTILFILIFSGSYSQIKWIQIDSLYQPLPHSIHIYKSIDSVDGKPNIMYYAMADLKDKNLLFTTDTTKDRRLTPSIFYQKNNQPILVVNTSFFSFKTHQNLNLVIKKGNIVSYNDHSIAGRKKDTLTYYHPFFSAIGISKKRKADVAWILSDTIKNFAYASQRPVYALHDSVSDPSWDYLNDNISVVVDSGYHGSATKLAPSFSKWEVQTAVGGGPVLVQNGEVNISNNIERKFSGKAIDDRHPRTAMGYTADNKIIVFVCEGRSKDAAGLSLTNMAIILKDIGCIEALNLDGGGSSCMLINGKETNTPSSKGVQRAVPSVFMIQVRNKE